MEYSVDIPSGVIWPILFPTLSVNQVSPLLLGPVAMPRVVFLSGSVNPVIEPLGVMRPISRVPYSVNHRLPSDPGAMKYGRLLENGSGNSVIFPTAFCAV